jgi:U4/U6.U5 tri-snRNP-associated protein 1
LQQEEEYIGRAKDRKKVDGPGPKSEFKLEYRDATGRLLTTKEAFRQMCYKFHGMEPGKMKQEKRLKELEIMNARKQQQMSLNVQKKKMESSGQAFIVLQQKKQ